MRRFFLLAFLLETLFFSASLQARQPVVIFGEDNYLPYSYINAEGEPSGVYVDLLRSVFDRMQNYEVQIELVPWERALAALEAGDVFAIFPPYRQSFDIRPFIGHYSPPLYEEEVIVFCRPSVFEQPPTQWPEDFYGLTIGTIAGYRSVGGAFWFAVAQQQIYLSEGETGWHKLMMLMDGRIDCYLNDRLSTLQYAEPMQDLWQGEAAQEMMVIARQYGHLAFGLENEARFPFYWDFIAIFEQILNEQLQRTETLTEEVPR